MTTHQPAPVPKGATVTVQFPGRRLGDPPLLLRVPEELRTIPGIERDSDAETEWAEREPLQRFSLAHGQFQAYYRRVALQPYIQAYGKQLEANAAACESTAEHLPTQPPRPGVDVTDAIARAARALGFAAVGFTPYDPRYTYADKRSWVRFDSVVCLALEQDYAATQQIPSEASEMTVWRHNVELGHLALALGERIRALGYRAQVHPPNQATCVIMPYFVEAGLGQLGANGQLLSPHFGSRARLTIITTDAPVRYDSPADFGVTGLCQRCQVCVRRCPGRALSPQPIPWRGVTKFKVDLRRCMPMLPRYDACAVCMKVCPVQKFGLKRVLDHYIETGGDILGKGTDELEGYTLPDKGYFGPGQLPKFTKSDFDVPDGPVAVAPSRYDISME